MAPSVELLAFARAISRLFGWIYFLAWSLSFYPQLLLNYRRRTTHGTTPDFPTANILGFLCLTFSNGALLFNTTVRSQYAARNPLAPNPTVRGNDFAFALHALVLCAIMWTQYMAPSWWGFKRVVGREGRVSLVIKVLCLAGIAVVAGGAVWAAVGGDGIDGESPGAGANVGAGGSSIGPASRQNITEAITTSSSPHHTWTWTWLDVVYLTGYLKLILTFLKYAPQLYLNYRRRSTVGMSMWQVMLDVIGGVLSLAQLVIDSALEGDWRSALLGNPVKLVLGNVSLLYNAGFCTQNWILYRGNRAEEEHGKAGSVDSSTEDDADENGVVDERSGLLPAVARGADTGEINPDATNGTR